MIEGFSCACTACFRTCISLDTTLFYTKLDRSITVLEQLRKQLVTAFPQLQVELPMQVGRAHTGLYDSLEDAADEDYSTPLFLLRGITPGPEAHAKIRDILGSIGEEQFVVANDMALHIYDNTIALMEWTLEALSPVKDVALSVSPRAIDRVTASISKILIAEMTCTYMAVLAAGIRKFHETSRRKSSEDTMLVFRHPGKLDLFFDLSTDTVQDGKGQHLWTSRTAVLPFFDSLASSNLKALTWYQRWSENDGEYLPLPEHHCDCRIGWGNSAVAGPECSEYLERFLSIKRRLQYFYAITIIHNKNLSNLFMRGSSATGEVLAKTLKKHKLVQTNLYYLESLMFDTENGLQGSAYRVYRTFFDQWRFQKLLSGSQRKAEIASSVLEGKIAEKRLAVQKNLRSLLVALSTIEVLGVIVELVHMANSSEIRTGGGWGILRLIRAESPDAIVTSVMFILAFLIVLIIVLGVQSEKE